MVIFNSYVKLPEGTLIGLDSVQPSLYQTLENNNAAVSTLKAGSCWIIFHRVPMGPHFAKVQH